MGAQDRATVAVGVDVGGDRKGFHAVALRDGRYFEKLTTRDPAEIEAWCRRMGAQAVGVDAPCRWSLTGRARVVERELAQKKIFTFATPKREAAEGRAFYRWMMNGAELFESLKTHYRLFDGSMGETPAGVCFETFPQAIACALSGEIVSAKQKRTVRRQLLRQAGIDTDPLTSIDFVDAGLCALAAHSLLSVTFKTYGEVTEGFIVVPTGEPKK